MNNDMKLIGYFAYEDVEALCIEEDACLVVDSKEKMEYHIKEMEKEEGQKRKYRIRKTRFGEIMEGIKLGEAYAFDEWSYKRFYSLGKEKGMELKEWNEEESEKNGAIFMILRDI